MRSSTFSIPTEIRMNVSNIPKASRVSFGIDACVIKLGISIKLSTAPKLSANVNTFKCDKNSLAFSMSP
ncbi:hypothetical protein DERP_008039 [Dermatophagoides pteronyssinus]|uniref:Uncharacterized protein n=1 Tax=Dermatophagoides pteronyssinus TaxID=6956 RepID=A0ABQ8JJJ6_DERPT|nr:hypothetical protein DERP_008039 [Dermatophagoides pteronyssinus]